ncbi:MAG: hypothetical protein SWC96_10215 [Thermodesulfobacteriota bacterium]|nr:hypothetical protein [Thermodesulfobacteriota bacterium]
MTGWIYRAAEAEQMGYVSRVFPEGTLVASVMAIAKSMAAYDRQCLQETKELSSALLNTLGRRCKTILMPYDRRPPGVP